MAQLVANGEQRALSTSRSMHNSFVVRPNDFLSLASSCVDKVFQDPLYRSLTMAVANVPRWGIAGAFGFDQCRGPRAYPMHDIIVHC
jgi:hypothetical protein